MRQTTKQTKTYQAPTIKVVQFMVELGYTTSVDTKEDGIGQNTMGQYNQANSTWSNSFGTGGQDESHF